MSLNSYTGKSVRAKVAYVIYLGSSSTSAPAYAVSIWLGVFGDISPLSHNDVPLIRVKIGNLHFNLFAGHSGDTVVYTFVSLNKVESFRGDLWEFYKYLEKHYGLNSEQYLQNVQARTIVFTAKQADFVTTEYTIDIS